MDQLQIKSIVEGLKSSSTNRVYETLIKIRSKVITTEEGLRLFRQCSGLEYLSPHLRKPNEKNIDLTLSVLGNCCMEEESNILVGKLNIFESLVSLLNTIKRDSIAGRACRVVGNLSQRNINAINLHKYGAVGALMTIINGRDKSTSYATLTMAVRAIRLLWMVTDKREEMLALKAVHCVATLLISECESAEIIKPSNSLTEGNNLKKSQEELFTGILKCLGYFTTYSTTQCAEQIQGDGKGYQCLIALTKMYESAALKCLMNLCFIASCRPALGMAGFVYCLIDILQNKTDITCWPDGAARALAHLSGESVNRSRLRHCGGLPLLVAAARTDTHAMRALLQYVFDDISLQTLINEGLIGLLTEELTKYLTTMDFQHSLQHEDIHSQTVRKRSFEEQEEEPTQESIDVTNEITVVKEKEPLFMRRKQKKLCNDNEDELRVVIERDNMLVRFMDTLGTDESEGEDIHNDEKRSHRKRSRYKNSNSTKIDENSKQKMGNKHWYSSVYWEQKSPERLGNNMQPSFPTNYSLSPEGQSGFSPEHSDYYSQNKRARWDLSPESGFSSGETSAASPYWTEYQWSPGSSNPTSPYSINDDSCGSEKSDRYSPVCSDVEDAPQADDNVTNSDALAEFDTTQVLHDFNDLAMEDDSNEGDRPLEDALTKMDTSTSSRIACVLVLMFRVSHNSCNTNDLPNERNNIMEQLSRKDCLNALLDYVERCKRPFGRAGRILYKVLGHNLCLINVLKHGLTLRLHSMSTNAKHPVTKCYQCKQVVRLSTKLLTQLSILTESSYGIGEISYQLLKGTSAMKETLSLTLPYIVRTYKPIRKFFIDCNALSLFFNIITESNEHIEHCVPGIAKLASNIRIKDPKILEQRFKDHVCVSYDPILDNLDPEDIITFELDDQSEVKANKIFLCQNSEVFSAMLTGCFKESIEKCVRLKNVTKPGLEYLLTLLHFGLNNPTCDIQTFPLADELYTNLEVVLLADRFLFQKLRLLLCSAITQFCLAPETAYKIYIWSINEGMGFLFTESLAYLLTGKMCDSDRTKSFKTILNLEYKEQWIDDLKTIILRHLGNNVSYNT